jgi:hypothetical protein
VWAPFNLKNILLQNGSIENTKPRAKIWKPPKPNSLEKQMGTILHKKKAYAMKGYWWLTLMLY